MGAIAASINMRLQSDRGRGQLFSSHYGRASRFDPNDHDGPHPLCQFALFLVGGTMFATGMYLFFCSYYDTRAEKVAEFNMQIQNWTVNYRPALDASDMQISINGSDWVPMIKDDAPNKVGLAGIELTRPDIRQYQDLQYDYSLVIPDEYFPHPDPQDPSAPLPGVNPVAFKIQARHADGRTDLVYSEDLPLRDWVVVGANQKMCRMQDRGVWHGGQCWSLKTLRSICVRVKQQRDWLTLNPDDTLQPDAWTLSKYRSGQSGCTAPSPLTYSSVRDVHASQLLIPGGVPRPLGLSPDLNGSIADLASASAPANNSLVLTSGRWVAITVRHNQDPYLVAYDTTDKTFTFGQTVRENFIEACVLISVGSLLLAPLAILWACRGGEEIYQATTTTIGGTRQRRGSGGTRIGRYAKFRSRSRGEEMDAISEGGYDEDSFESQSASRDSPPRARGSGNARRRGGSGDSSRERKSKELSRLEIGDHAREPQGSGSDVFVDISRIRPDGRQQSSFDE